jgi:hypothetical protein
MYHQQFGELLLHYKLVWVVQVDMSGQERKARLQAWKASSEF